MAVSYTSGVAGLAMPMCHYTLAVIDSLLSASWRRARRCLSSERTYCTQVAELHRRTVAERLEKRLREADRAAWRVLVAGAA